MTKVTLILGIFVSLIFDHKSLNIVSNNIYKPKQHIWAFRRSRSRSPASCDPHSTSLMIVNKGFFVEIAIFLQIRESRPKSVFGK